MPAPCVLALLLLLVGAAELEAEAAAPPPPPPPPLAGAAAAVDAWVVGPMIKVLPSTPTPPAAAPPAAPRAALDGARSQHVQFQIALRPPTALRAVTVVPTALLPVDAAGRSPIGSAAFSPTRRVTCVNVSNKDGTSAGLWPDPLPLLSSGPSDAFAPNTTGALWVEVAVPADAGPGVYEGSVAVLAGCVRIASVPVSLTVWNFSVARRSLRTDSKLSEQWVSRFLAREPEGANLTAVVLNYYREMAAHRVTMMGWGGVSIFPSVTATFSDDLGAVTLDTTGWDAMVSELEALGMEQVHFPLVAACSCCEPITHIRTPIPQVIPPNATW